MTQFDVSHTSEWKPLFNKSCEAPIGVVHDLNFEYRNSLEVNDLEKIIKLKVIKKISSWRTHSKTIWNR